MSNSAVYLVYCECGHSHLASKTTASVLPNNGEMFMITRTVEDKAKIASSRGIVITSKIKEVYVKPLLHNNTKYMRITTENSVLSLIVVQEI